jgi:Arc/MetJ family transcription regulator
MGTTTEDRGQKSQGRRKRTTLPIDPVLLEEARRKTGAKSNGDAVEAALRALIRPRPRAVALGKSGDPELARNLDRALEGFGEQ